MKKLYILIMLIVLASLWGCGNVAVDLDENTYNPKIVVEGYVYPGQAPSNILLSRNYGLNTNIDLNDFVLTDAQVTITDVDAGLTYDLEFNPLELAYAYPGSDFVIDYGKSYKLDLQATIDGKTLTASAVTTTPEAGFTIDDAASVLGTKNYDQAVEDDSKFILKFHRSPSIDSYISSIVAVDANMDTFIEDNVFGIDKDDIDEHADAEELRFYNMLKNQSMWTMTELGATDDLSTLEIEWFSTWFYGNYRVIMYCADVNMTEYFLTHNQIMEEDGNLLEPKFHFEGDAIGVFGSAVTDTVYFELTR